MQTSQNYLQSYKAGSGVVNGRHIFGNNFPAMGLRSAEHEMI
jgi:hypothetical protein